MTTHGAVFFSSAVPLFPFPKVKVLKEEVLAVVHTVVAVSWGCFMDPKQALASLPTWWIIREQYLFHRKPMSFHVLVHVYIPVSVHTAITSTPTVIRAIETAGAFTPTAAIQAILTDTAYHQSADG